MSEYFNRAGKPITMLEWAVMFGDESIKRVAFDRIDVDGVDVWVSTVWLGLDHSWTGSKLIFETMIFGGQHNEWQGRYETEEQALAGHADAVRMVTTTERANNEQ